MKEQKNLNALVRYVYMYIETQQKKFVFNNILIILIMSFKSIHRKSSVRQGFKNCEYITK